MLSEAKPKTESQRLRGVARAREILIKCATIMDNMKSYISPKVKIGKSKIGKGLFALKKISRGELIIDFTKGPGKFLTTKEAVNFTKKATTT
jgi:hypothetical protein